MKTRRILATILTFAMLLTLLPATITVSAATDPVVFTKELLPAASGQPRKIKLEAYTTGSTSSTSAAVPADIVLVLDQSGSMDDTIDGSTKLSIMKNAVTSFASEVANFNTSNNDSYRLAIVGFASESGYNDNTEILTVYNTQTVTNVEYQRVTDITNLDTNKTYYIQSGDEYRAISYHTNPMTGLFQWGDAGWYTSGYLFVGDKVNIQSTAIYERITTSTNVPATTPGIAYGSLSDENYANAFVNCTSTNIASTGTIGMAIAQLDGEGATRTDLGMEMAEKIFASQPDGKYANRKKIMVVITDGVPTTASDFSTTVANDAVSAAKSMKDDGAHIFSMYLGTPSTDSVSFLQALSSNYPEATAYDTLGTKIADSYYSAHTQSSAVTNVFHDIAFSITANSTLDEKSVITDTISEYFRLPAVEGGVYDLEQISVYTVDKTSSGWATEEKPFTTASVTIEGGKTIKVTGFNFGYHCVTDSPKDGTGGTDFGRKLVIYIPIVENENADTFGGYLPTNDGAGIYQTETSGTAEITAPNKYDNVDIKYDLLDEEYWKHIGTQTSFTLEYNDTTLNDILATMIPAGYRPDGVKNIGVTMQYSLVDTNLTSDASDDTVIATLDVSEGTSVDVTDFANWILGANVEKVLSIVSGTNHAEAMYRLDCVLTNINDSGITLTESSYLDVEIVNENVHLVGGVIDNGGALTVEPATIGGTVTGTQIDNTYREEVTAGTDTAKMIFLANTGYEISKILHITSSHHDTPLDTTTTLFDVENSINNVTFETDGSYIFQATNVQSGQAIEVYTRPIVYTLTTAHDSGSIIMDGTTYTHHNSELLEVFFKAHEGYRINSIEVDGHTYMAADMISNTTIFNLEIDGTEILSGDVHLSKTQNHDVKVTSVKRTYDLTYKYYEQQDNGTFTELTAEQENNTDVEFGSSLPMPSKLAGDKTKPGYTLRGWFATRTGTEFTDLADLSATKMPTKDVTYYAFWEKDPDQTFEIPDTGKITKKLLNANGAVEANGSEITFKFRAVFHEQVVGEGTITLGASETEKEGERITVTLTGLQLARYNAGDPIYLYEVHGSDSTWIYDDARYAIYHNGTIENSNGTTASKVVFTNQKAPYLVNYDLDGGDIGGNTTIAPKIVSYAEANLLPASDPVKAGFNFIGWKKDTINVDNTKTYAALAGSETVTAITLVAQYEKLTTPVVPTAVKYIVEHYRANQNGEYPTTPNDTEMKTDAIGATVTAVAKTGGDYANYCVNEQVSAATKSATLVAIASPADIVTLKLYYDIDVIGGGVNPDEGDEIPDIYQKKITFKILNGKWQDSTSNDIVKVVDLRDGGGQYSSTGTADITSIIPTGMTKNTGYDDPGEWRESPPTEVSGTEPVSYTYVFHKTPDVVYDEYKEDEPEPTPQTEEYTATQKIQVDPNGGVWHYEGQNHTTIQTIELQDNIDLGTPTRDGYVFMGWKQTSGTGEIVHIYTAQWEKDDIGTTNPDDGDDVADIFQKKIIFKVVNGTWANDTTVDIVIVVNLLDGHGKHSKNGQADIAGYIPVGMKANSGYHNGAWDINPVSPAIGTETVTYTYSFEKVPTGGGGGGVTRYTLTYESNGGTAYDKETYNRNTTVDINKKPEKEGYVFEGWYEDKELTKYVEEVKMTKDITVYAKWVEDNGGAGNGYDTPGSLNGEDHFAYVVGYPDGTVRPNDNISRAEVTAIFFRLLKPDEVRDKNLTTENNFNDVNDGEWHNTSISTMAKLGIVKGRYSDRFVPDAFITRAEFAAICARFDDSEFEVVDNFTDVAGHWAEHDIHEAAAHGWIRGYEDGTFKPDQFITRAEAMTMINRVLNRVPETADDLLADMINWPDNSDKSAWYYLAVQEATNSHDYEMKNHIYEKWTALRAVTDWTKYE